MTGNINFSVVIPVFNSSETLIELHNRIENVFHELGKSYEVIFVDDNSNDSSWKTLKKIKSQDNAHVRIIRLNKNFGQHNATLCGFGIGKGEFIITLDDDLQTPPEEIVKLIDAYKKTKTDVVYGVSKQKHPLHRRITGRFWKFLAKRIGNGIGEGSSFRLISSGMIKNILSHDQQFVFIDEIIVWYTMYIDYVNVEHQKRRSGRSGYSSRKLLLLSGKMLIHYTQIPLRLMIICGAFFSTISFLAGIYYIVKKIFFNVPVQGFTLTIVVIFFSTSIIMLCFGIVGDYLGRIFGILNGKPQYTIKEEEL